MPTYEYRCETCNHQFEVFAGMNDPAPDACEACGAAALKKLLFPVAVHYKGSGFYSTDYSGSKSAAGGSDGGSDSASSSDSSGSSESSGSSSTSADSASSTTSTGSTSNGSSDA